MIKPHPMQLSYSEGLFTYYVSQKWGVQTLPPLCQPKIRNWLTPPPPLDCRSTKGGKIRRGSLDLARAVSLAGLRVLDSCSWVWLQQRRQTIIPVTWSETCIFTNYKADFQAHEGPDLTTPGLNHNLSVDITQALEAPTLLLVAFKILLAETDAL